MRGSFPLRKSLRFLIEEPVNAPGQVSVLEALNGNVDGQHHGGGEDQRSLHDRNSTPSSGSAYQPGHLYLPVSRWEGDRR